MRQRARDGEALLLAAGELGAEDSRRSFTSSQSAAWRRHARRARRVRAVADAGHPRREGDVVVDGQRQADRQRHDHADPAAQIVDVLHLEDVLAVDEDVRPRCVTSAYEVDRAVDAPEERGLAGLPGR